MHLDGALFEAERVAKCGHRACVDAGNGGAAEIDGDSVRLAVRQGGAEAFLRGHYGILLFPVFHSIEKRVSSAFHAHILARYGVDLAVAIEQPRESDYGEMAVPAAFQLAKQLRQAPRKIAAELAAEIGPIAGVAALEVAGNGYLNVRLDRGAFAAGLLAGEEERAAGGGEKIIVEHTNINPNKAAHIGHLRNATLGDTFVRMLRALRRDRGGAELHRQHRRAGGRRRGRLPLPGEQNTGGRARADGGSRGPVRLLLLGPLRAHVDLLQGAPGIAGLAQPDAALDRGGRRRAGRNGAPGGRRHRGGAPGHHAAAGGGVRRAAAGERDPAPEVLGARLSSCSRSARRSTSKPRARMRAVG